MDNFTVPNDNLDKHECPLAVIKCVDFRFRSSDQEFVERGLGFSDFDIYAWPGAAKDVLKNNGFKTSFIEYIVAVSRGLHKVKKLLLLWHWDCGGYGGSKAFSSVEEEESLQRKHLVRARDFIRDHFPLLVQDILRYGNPSPTERDNLIRVMGNGLLISGYVIKPKDMDNPSEDTEGGWFAELVF